VPPNTITLRFWALGVFSLFIRAGLSVNELNSFAGAPFYNGLPHSSAFFLRKGGPALSSLSSFMHMPKPAGEPRGAR
jgi:hypothetical protein